MNMTSPKILQSLKISGRNYQREKFSFVAHSSNKLKDVSKFDSLSPLVLLIGLNCAFNSKNDKTY